MHNFYIRKLNPRDKEDIIDICYKTGYLGEDLTGKDLFNDKILFGYLFCTYYIEYEPEHCFVAVDKNKVIGYIIGSDNSIKQENMFKKKMLWRIAKRLMGYSLWVYPESFNSVIHFVFKVNMKPEPQNLFYEYTAHLHINILDDYQHMGIGSELIDSFENEMKKSGVNGIHIRTTNENIKAVPFYLRHGYKVAHEEKCEIWKGEEGCKNLVFVKKLR